MNKSSNSDQNNKPRKSVVKSILKYVFLVILIVANVFVYILAGDIYNQVVSISDKNSTNPVLSFIAKVNNISKKEEVNSENVNSTFKLSILGNIVNSDKLSENDKNTEYDFNDIKSVTEKSDATISMFEGNITGASNLLKELKTLDITSLNIGSAAIASSAKEYKSTIDAFHNLGISTTGAYLKDENKRPLILEKNNVRVGILSYLDSSNNDKISKEPYILSQYGRAGVINDIDYLISKDIDFIISLVNFNDTKNNISKNEKEVAEFMAENGVNAMFGYHSDTILDGKNIKGEDSNCFVSYSMGNLISSTVQNNHDMGLIINLELKKSGKERRIDSINYVPTYIDKDGNKYTILNAKNIVDNYSSNKNSTVSETEYKYLKDKISKIDDIIDVKK